MQICQSQGQSWSKGYQGFHQRPSWTRLIKGGAHTHTNFNIKTASGYTALIFTFGWLPKTSGRGIVDKGAELPFSPAGMIVSGEGGRGGGQLLQKRRQIEQPHKGQQPITNPQTTYTHEHPHTHTQLGTWARAKRWAKGQFAAHPKAKRAAEFATAELKIVESQKRRQVNKHQLGWTSIFINALAMHHLIKYFKRVISSFFF